MGCGIARVGGLNQQTNGSGQFILNINTSPKENLMFIIYLRYSSSTRRPAMFSLVLSRSGPVLDLTPTRARAPALCVMGGQQWLLGDACLPTHTRAPTLRVTVYGLTGTGGLNQQTNGLGQFILNINTSPKENLMFTIYLRYSSSTHRSAMFSLALPETTLFLISLLHVHER